MDSSLDDLESEALGIKLSHNSFDVRVRINGVASDLDSCIYTEFVQRVGYSLSFILIEFLPMFCYTFPYFKHLIHAPIVLYAQRALLYYLFGKGVVRKKRRSCHILNAEFGDVAITADDSQSIFKLHGILKIKT